MGVEEDIPIKTVLRLIGGKHKIAIVWMLSAGGPKRFSEIRKVLEGDATSRMLSISLKELEADGLISKKVLSESPPHTEYALTTVGMSLIPILDDLCAWGAAYQDMVAVKGSLRPRGPAARCR
ncbi:MAG: helix-turn-helix domain-containing protein [Thermoplasmata archaeon]|nr:helix-turn-helix domain-containing protein [Thermoplasmata archaeon]